MEKDRKERKREGFRPGAGDDKKEGKGGIPAWGRGLNRKKTEKDKKERRGASRNESAVIIYKIILKWHLHQIF